MHHYLELPQMNTANFDNSQNSDHSIVPNEVNVSIPSFIDKTSSNNTTLDQSNNDSTYVPEPDSTVNSLNLTDLTLDKFSENDYDNNKNDSIDYLISSNVAPALEKLIVKNSDIEQKKTFCCYCFELRAVPSRHYRDVHSNEKEVKEFLEMKKNSKERAAAIEKLRLKGNNIYNLNKDFNKGKLLVSRQPRKTSIVNSIDYRPCSKCGKWLLDVKRHKCPEMKDHFEDRSYIVKSKIMMGQIHPNANELARKILAINNENEISETVRYDPLLILFVNDLSERYTNQHQHKMIRSRLRMLGSILLKIQEYNQAVFKNDKINQLPNPVDVKTFADIIDPRLYDNMIIAVQAIAGVNAEKSECRAPSTATTAGTWITKIAKIHQKELIKQLKYDEAQHVEYFLKVHEVEFLTKINTLARNVQIKQKRYKQESLPTMDDINKFRSFIESQIVSAVETLEEGFNYHAWKKMSQCTLIFILLFNRKRPGELERIRIDDFKKAKTFKNTNKNEYARLSADDKKLVDEYLRIEFGGKKGREVPLLLSSSMRDFINTVITYRTDAQVHKDNPFIFGLPGFDGTRYKHLEACVLMRNFSKRCNAEYPERLRATGLRKHFATTVASLKIDECQIYDVSNFMGHAEKIHRDFYRQTVVTRDVCGVSQILEVASGVIGVIQRDKNVPTSIQKQSIGDRSNDLQTSASPVLLESQDEMNNRFETEDLLDSTKSENYESKKRQLVSPVLSDEEETNYSKKTKVHDVSSVQEGKRINTKKTWTKAERELVSETFSNYIKSMKVPPSAQMSAFLVENPSVKRTLPQLRTWIHNQFAQKLREQKQ